MATLALIYDVHGNLPALEAVLEDARREGRDSFLLGGDYALFGPWPDGDGRGAARAAGRQLDPRQRRPLDGASPNRSAATQGLQEARSRPAARRPGGGAGRRARSLPERLADRRRAVLPRLPGVGHEVVPARAGRATRTSCSVTSAAPRRVVFGHTHLQFRRTRGRRRRAGQSGLGRHAARRRPSRRLRARAGRDELEHRRVAYDHEASARAVRQRFGDADGPCGPSGGC